MSKGKFSNPRPHREEDRQIEQAYRQLTSQDPKSRPVITPRPTQEDPFREVPVPEEALPDLDALFTQPEVPAWEAPLPDYDPEEEYDPGEEDTVDRLLSFGSQAARFCKENKAMVLAFSCALVLVIVLGITALSFAGSSDPYDGKILDNVFIADVYVGGLTKNQATTVLTQATGDSYATQAMVIDLGSTTLRLEPGDVNASLDVKSAVSAAFAYGRSGTKAQQEADFAASQTGSSHVIALLPYLKLDQNYIQNALAKYASGTSSALTQTNYGLEGKQPELSADKFDPDAPGQTLVITMGTPGLRFDAEAVYAQILDAYSLRRFLVTVENTEPVSEPEPVDLEAIYEEFYIAPVDAAVDMQTFETVPGSYGYGFDLEKAQALVDAAAYGEVIRIPMEYIPPELLNEEVFFQDLLAEVKTPSTGSKNRKTNLSQACQAISGLLLNPGETFSFNDTLGKITEKKGYKYAPDCLGQSEEEILGGGICQVASTLYHASLLADLSTVSRTSHTAPTAYADLGLDAYVNRGSADLKFRNSTNYPIRIEAEVSGGSVTVRLYSTDRRTHYVEMESETTNTIKPKTVYEDYPFDNEEGYRDGDVIREGVTGYYVKTYKRKFDSLTGELISREFETSSQYKAVDKLVARVEPEPTETTVPETTVPETTEPETTPPTVETTAPTEPEAQTAPTQATDPYAEEAAE